MEPRDLLLQVDRDLALYLDKIRHCLGLLREEQVWWRPNRRSNSVGNLVLHLSGNLSQWLLEGLGGQPYKRHRSREFSADGVASKAELGELLDVVVSAGREVLAAIDEADLTRVRTIQGRDTDGWHALLHVWEHMSYHTGQVVMLTKQQIADDVELDFYPQHRGE